MLNAAVSLVHANGTQSLHANFRVSGHNSVCLQVLKKSELVFDETGPSFRWVRGVTCLPHPDWIQCLIVRDEAVTPAADCYKDLR
jgi:hypothetical protein